VFWLNEVRSVLAEEPEEWLDYLHGQQLSNLPNLGRLRRRLKGVVGRSFVLLGWAILRTRAGRRLGRRGQKEILCYVSTHNQRAASEPAVIALREEGLSVLRIAEPEVSKGSSGSVGYYKLSFGLRELGKGAWLFCCRVRPLLYRLRKKSSYLAIERLDSFAKSYFFLVCFERLIREAQPRLVLISNDHNPEARCLQAICRRKGVATAYIQHASVSRYFPALTVTYAFLDGRAGLENYKQCEENIPATLNKNLTRNVFLSGQKKSIKRAGRRGSRFVGVAVNSLDAPEDIMSTVAAIASGTTNLKVRWHPSTSRSMADQLIESLSNIWGVNFSDPRDESTETFLGELRCLIAGNSSIHLEAALAGVVPVYWEITTQDTRDYYGYVKNGLSVAPNSFDKLIRLVQAINENNLTLNNDAVRYYSATFGTDWQDKEGALVANYVRRILDGEKPSELWGFVDNWSE